MTVTRTEVLNTLKAHQDELRELGVATLDLFGSVAREEATNASDVDLLASFDRPISLFEFIDLKIYLETIIGTPVDLVTRTGLKPRLRDRVLSEAIRAT